jgi:hypothetical protein
MLLFSEPESWIGLRSERTVAGEFDLPASGGIRRLEPSAADRTVPWSLRVLRARVERAMARIRGR